MLSPWPLYRYRGKVIRTVDGDTVEILLDFGMKVYHQVHIRVKGINSPEMVGENKARGILAKAALEHLIGGEIVYVKTYEDRQSFTRYVGDIITGDGTDVAEFMVANGYAEVYHG